MATATTSMPHAWSGSIRDGNARRWLALVTGLIVTGCATVWLFLHFDRHSHSASDTLRPFLITAAPLWLMSFLAARLLVGRSK